MAVAESFPIAAESMVAILRVQPFLDSQFFDDEAELADIFILLLDFFVVFLELAGINNFQLSNSLKSSSTLSTA